MYVCMYIFISSAYTKTYIYKTTSKYEQHRFKHKEEMWETNRLRATLYRIYNIYSSHI